MMAAAKERISWSEGPGVALPLAAAVPVAKNSRPGFELKKINSRPGWSEVNFKTVSGIGVSLRQNGIGSRCQSLNRYAYVLNNPTTLTDPTGLCSAYDYTYTITDPETGQTTVGFHVDTGPCPPEPPTIGCANMDGYGCGYSGANYAYTGAPTTSGGGGAGGAGAGTYFSWW